MTAPPVSQPLDLEREVGGLLAQVRIPTATYRLQLTPNFGFRAAAEVVPYLHDLGVSDVYLSPILRARSGSTHGYDVADPTQLNPELGSEADFHALSDAVRSRGMGLILDIVPNHMGVGDPANGWWLDVLENGPASAHAGTFDINWHPVTPELEHKVLLAVLEDQYGNELERGAFTVALEDGAGWLDYHRLRLPLAPETYGDLLRPAVSGLEGLPAEDPQGQELHSILTALDHLPPRVDSTPDQVVERAREKEVVKRRLAALLQASPEVAAAVAAAVAELNGTVGAPQSFAALDHLIDRQSYRLAFWRVSSEEINYRRFFDVDDLAAIRVELPTVFEPVHALVLRLLAEGRATGLRVDHADGLRDPAAYFWQLQVGYVLARLRADHPDAPLPDDAADRVAALLRAEATATTPPRWPLYVVAEKILAEGEQLPQSWAVYGTTGYDFLKLAGGLFVDGRRLQAFDRFYRRVTGIQTGYHDVANASKKVVMLVSMASEINALAHNLERLVKRSRHYRDFTLNNLTFALREVVAALPVYRTYVMPAGAEPSPAEQRWVQQAVAEAERRNPRTLGALFTFLEATLLLHNRDDFPPDDQPALLAWVLRFQQVTGSVMAKGAEDTAFYRYHRLAALNEVGGDPEAFGVSPAEFHRGNALRQRRWPASLLATATHDTKRGEDVRTRLAALTEYPDQWRARVLAWTRRHRRLKRRPGGGAAPDANDEYLLYQTLVGVWPSEQPEAAALAELAERVAAYLLKATREAKVHTSWISPNAAYEQALHDFVHALLQPDSEMVADLAVAARTVARAGAVNSLAQLALRATAPGVPDTYQGCELWDLSLVDPDNRRPVDFAARAALLQGLAPADGPPADWHSGAVKLFVLQRLLHLRRERPALFAAGEYLPLRASGAPRRQVVAFARRLGVEWAVTVAPRLCGGPLPADEALWQPPAWEDGALLLPAGAPTRWRDTFTGAVFDTTGGHGRELPLPVLLAHFPIAMLTPLGD